MVENSVRFGSVICQVDACEKFPAIDEVIDRCSVFHDLPISTVQKGRPRREHIETTVSDTA
jgi:hypothetical protein